MVLIHSKESGESKSKKSVKMVYYAEQWAGEEVACLYAVCWSNWLGQTANLLIPTREWCARLSINWCLHMDLTQREGGLPDCCGTGTCLGKGADYIVVLLQLICYINKPAHFLGPNLLFTFVWWLKKHFEYPHFGPFAPAWVQLPCEVQFWLAVCELK